VRFKRAVIRDDGGGFGDEDGDDMGDEYEGNADVADMAKDKGADASDEDIADDLEFGGGVGKGDEEQL
jgi:hypothetical protein